MVYPSKIDQQGWKIQQEDNMHSMMLINQVRADEAKREQQNERNLVKQINLLSPIEVQKQLSIKL